MVGVASGLPDRIDAGPVVLCRRRVADVPELTAAIRSSIDDLSAFLRWAASGVPTREQLEGSATARDADFEAGTGFEYVMREAASDDLVGETGGDVRADASVVEIGYWLRTDRTGQWLRDRGRRSNHLVGVCILAARDSRRDPDG